MAAYSHGPIHCIQRFFAKYGPGTFGESFALIIQVSLAILVVMAVNGRRIRWYLLALLLHTVVDGILPYFTSAVVLEAALGMESLGILALSLALWRRMQKQSET